MHMFFFIYMSISIMFTMLSKTFPSATMLLPDKARPDTEYKELLFTE